MLSSNSSSFGFHEFVTGVLTLVCLVMCFRIENEKLQNVLYCFFTFIPFKFLELDILNFGLVVVFGLFQIIVACRLDETTPSKR